MSEKLHIDAIVGAILGWDSEIAEHSVYDFFKWNRHTETAAVDWDESLGAAPLQKCLLKSLLIRVFREYYGAFLEDTEDSDLYFIRTEQTVTVYKGEEEYKQARKEKRMELLTSMWRNFLTEDASDILRTTQSKTSMCRDLEYACRGYTKLLNDFSDDSMGQEFETTHGMVDVVFHSPAGDADLNGSSYAFSYRTAYVVENATKATVTMEVFEDTVNPNNPLCSKVAFELFIKALGAEDVPIAVETGSAQHMLAESSAFSHSKHTRHDTVVRYIAVIDLPNATNKS